jgi:hypothetical protein
MKLIRAKWLLRLACLIAIVTFTNTAFADSFSVYVDDGRPYRPYYYPRYPHYYPYYRYPPAYPYGRPYRYYRGPCHWRPGHHDYYGRWRPGHRICY